MAKLSNLSGEARDHVLAYVKSRWSQYSSATREARKDATTFIAAVNTGGAAAVLAFTGSIVTNNPKLASAFPLKLALALFVVGVALSACAHVIEHARLSRLFAKWRADVKELYAYNLDFDVMQDDDDKRSRRHEFIPTLCIALALVCFAVGAGAGVRLFFTGG